MKAGDLLDTIIGKFLIKVIRGSQPARVLVSDSYEYREKSSGMRRVLYDFLDCEVTRIEPLINLVGEPYFLIEVDDSK